MQMPQATETPSTSKKVVPDKFYSLMEWFDGIEGNEDPLALVFVRNLRDMIAYIANQNIWGVSWRAKFIRMMETLSFTLQQLEKESSHDASLLLIARVLEIKEEISFVTSFLKEMLEENYGLAYGMCPYFENSWCNVNDRFKIKQKDPKGFDMNDKPHQKCASLMIRPLLKLVNSRQKEVETLYQNLYYYESVRRGRTNTICAKIVDLFTIKADLVVLFKEVQHFFDQIREPGFSEDSIHDFSLDKFILLKKIDQRLSKTVEAVTMHETSPEILNALLGAAKAIVGPAHHHRQEPSA